MADVLTPEQRRRNMAAIKGKNTKPEMVVRSLVHAMGYRYRLHAKHLPGKPDLVFPSRRKVILVHGCYWHMHSCRYGQVVPKTNAAFWQNKRLSNVMRDRRNLRDLKRLGWETLVVWECWVKHAPDLEERLIAFLEGKHIMDSKSEGDKTMQKQQFLLDATGDTLFEGFFRDEYWNGFACPYFTFEQAQAVVDAWQQNGWEAAYEPENDSYKFSVNHDLETGTSEEFEVFQSVVIDGRKFYPVGAFTWTWDIEPTPVAQV